MHRIADEQARLSGATIRIESDCVVKQQPPEFSRCELNRSRLGGEVARNSGLFRVPEILEYDEAKSEITFERIRGLRPLRVLLTDPRNRGLLERAACALAAIHGSGPESAKPDVMWHGDFGLGNLLFTENPDELFIIDWCNAFWTGEPPDRSVGPASFDLGILLLSLFPHRIGGRDRIPDRESLATSFLEGYAAATDAFDPAELHALMPSLNQRLKDHWVRNRGLPSALVYAPSMARMVRFVARFAKEST